MGPKRFCSSWQLFSCRSDSGVAPLRGDGRLDLSDGYLPVWAACLRACCCYAHVAVEIKGSPRDSSERCVSVARVPPTAWSLCL